jgi:hypothetical protein
MILYGNLPYANYRRDRIIFQRVSRFVEQMGCESNRGIPPPICAAGDFRQGYLTNLFKAEINFCTPSSTLLRGQPTLSRTNPRPSSP